MSESVMTEKLGLMYHKNEAKSLNSHSILKNSEENSSTSDYWNN